MEDGIDDFLLNTVKNGIRNNSQKTIDFAVKNGFNIAENKEELMNYSLDNHLYEGLKLIISRSSFKYLISDKKKIHIEKLGVCDFSKLTTLHNLEEIVINNCTILNINNITLLDNLRKIKVGTIINKGEGVIDRMKNMCINSGVELIVDNFMLNEYMSEYLDFHERLHRELQNISGITSNLEGVIIRNL